MAESQIFEQARRRREKIGVFCLFETLNKSNTMFSAAGGGEKIGFLETLNQDF